MGIRRVSVFNKFLRSTDSPEHPPFAVSFSGLGHLAFYTAGKLHLFDMKGHTVCNHILRETSVLVAHF